MSKTKDKAAESYETDTFEDPASVSKSQSAEGGSGKKDGINYWPGSKAYRDESASVS